MTKGVLLENPSLHQTVLRLVSQSAALARRAWHQIRDARRDRRPRRHDRDGRAFRPDARAGD